MNYKNYIKYNIIILSLHTPKFNYLNDLFKYSSNIAYIRGTALNIFNLIKSGVFYAKRIVIANANHSIFIDKNTYRLDNEVIIIRNLIHQLYQEYNKDKNNYVNFIKKIFKKEYEDKNINNKIFYSNIKFSNINNEIDNLSCDILSYKSFELENENNKFNIFNVNKNPYIICIIKYSESLEYIDANINLTYENYNDNEKMNKIWNNCGEYIYTFELVSANIFVDEMLHNLISFSLPLSKYAIEYSVIYSLIGANKDKFKNNNNFKINSGSVFLVSIPSYFYKKSFYKCFSYFLHTKNYLCIGILRYLNIKLLPSGYRKQFILSCPLKNMKIKKHDMAYVIAKKID